MQPKRQIGEVESWNYEGNQARFDASWEVVKGAVNKAGSASHPYLQGRLLEEWMGAIELETGEAVGYYETMYFLDDAGIMYIDPKLPLAFNVE